MISDGDFRTFLFKEGTNRSFDGWVFEADFGHFTNEGLFKNIVCEGLNHQCFQKGPGICPRIAL